MTSYVERSRSAHPVVLRRRSANYPGQGKKIHGIVFDHPSMPKIMAVSSVSRPAATAENVPDLGRRVRPEPYPVRKSPPGLIHSASAETTASTSGHSTYPFPYGDNPSLASGGTPTYPSSYSASHQQTQGYSITGHYGRTTSYTNKHGSVSGDIRMIDHSRRHAQVEKSRAQLPQVYQNRQYEASRDPNEVSRLVHFDQSQTLLSEGNTTSALRHPTTGNCSVPLTHCETANSADRSQCGTRSLNPRLNLDTRLRLNSDTRLRITQHVNARRHSTGGFRHHFESSIRNHSESTTERTNAATRTTASPDFARHFHDSVWGSCNDVTRNRTEFPCEERRRESDDSRLAGESTLTAPRRYSSSSGGESSRHSALRRGNTFDGCSFSPKQRDYNGYSFHEAQTKSFQLARDDFPAEHISPSSLSRTPKSDTTSFSKDAPGYTGYTSDTVCTSIGKTENTVRCPRRGIPKSPTVVVISDSEDDEVLDRSPASSPHVVPEDNLSDVFPVVYGVHDECGKSENVTGITRNLAREQYASAAEDGIKKLHAEQRSGELKSNTLASVKYISVVENYVDNFCTDRPDDVLKSKSSKSNPHPCDPSKLNSGWRVDMLRSKNLEGTSSLSVTKDFPKKFNTDQRGVDLKSRELESARDMSVSEDGPKTFNADLKYSMSRCLFQVEERHGKKLYSGKNCETSRKHVSDVKDKPCVAGSPETRGDGSKCDLMPPSLIHDSGFECAGNGAQFSMAEHTNEYFCFDKRTVKREMNEEALHRKNKVPCTSRLDADYRHGERLAIKSESDPKTKRLSADLNGYSLARNSEQVQIAKKKNIGTSELGCVRSVEDASSSPTSEVGFLTRQLSKITDDRLKSENKKTKCVLDSQRNGSNLCSGQVDSVKRLSERRVQDMDRAAIKNIPGKMVTHVEKERCDSEPSDGLHPPKFADRELPDKFSTTEKRIGDVALPNYGKKPTGIVVGVKQERRTDEPLASATADDVDLAKRGKDEYIASCRKTGADICQRVGVLQFNDVEKGTRDVSRKNEDRCARRANGLRDEEMSSQQWGAYSLKLEKELAKKQCDFEESRKIPEYVRKKTGTNEWQERDNVEPREDVAKQTARLNPVLAGIENERQSTQQRPADVLSESELSEVKEMVRRQVEALNGLLGGKDDVGGKRSGRYLQDGCEFTITADRDGKCVVQIRSKRPNMSEKDRDGDERFEPAGRDCDTNNNSLDVVRSVEDVSGSRQTVPKLVAESDANAAYVPTSSKVYRQEECVKSKPDDLSTLGQGSALNGEKSSGTSKDMQVENAGVMTPVKQEPGEESSKDKSSERKSVEIGCAEGTYPEDRKPKRESPDDTDSQAKCPEEEISVDKISECKNVEAESPERRRALTADEWKEILLGRIEQVRESIEMEETPWKMKNKRKVLEKLEHQLKWWDSAMNDEAAFITRRLQFFQTMRSQYELMKKIGVQRNTTKNAGVKPAPGTVPPDDRPKTKDLKVANTTKEKKHKAQKRKYSSNEERGQLSSKKIRRNATS